MRIGNLRKLLIITVTGLVFTGINMQGLFLQEKVEAMPRPAGLERVSPAVRIDREMQDFSDYIGIPKQDLMQYYNEGWDMRDISQGAFLSYTSQKSLSDIMKMREQYPWRRIIYFLELTPNDLFEARNKLEGKYLAEKLNVNQTVITFLVERMYTSDEIVHGVIYSEYVSDKSPADIIEMHNPPTSNWQMVAEKLGITENQLQEINKRIESIDLYIVKAPHMI